MRTLLVLALLLLPSVAHAYIGPGAGITAIGSLIALLGAAALAILGFVWYPIKRLRRSRAKAAKPVTTQDSTAADSK